MKATTIQIIRGTDQTFAVTFTDSSGSPINLTGQTVFFTVKEKNKIDESDITDTNAIIQKIVTTHSNPTQGQTNIILTSQDTLVPAGNYLYDLKLVSGSGAVSCIISSEFDVVDPVTNRNS